MMIELLQSQLHGKKFVEQGAIGHAYCVYNPELAANFVTQRGILQRRQREDPALFNKTDWKSNPDRQVPPLLCRFF